jgi:hypothetical protein
VLPVVTALTAVQRMKLQLLADGLAVDDDAAARLRAVNDDRSLTPADYASTSGLILELAGEVWVNAPIATYNPSFVRSPRHHLRVEDDQLVVEGPDAAATARVWLPPRYHGQDDEDFGPFNNYAFTHGDRVRLAPIRGCGMTCQFCNIPYEDRYGTKPAEALVTALDRALRDELQPARHVLISGGTPHARDADYLRDVYRTVLKTFPEVDIDIMMSPAHDVLDLEELDELGVHELSINLEITNQALASRMMRQKHAQGLDHHLGWLAKAADVLGGHRVRSMLMVGLEPLEDTVRGVELILERGCVPVLSPFRPDEATPLRNLAPPSAAQLEETYLAAVELADAAGVALGPTCAPCTHNTLTFVPSSAIDAAEHRHPTMA